MCTVVARRFAVNGVRERIHLSTCSIEIVTFALLASSDAARVAFVHKFDACTYSHRVFFP